MHPHGFDCRTIGVLKDTQANNLTKPVAKFLIGYVGSIGVSNALDQLFQAAEKTIDDASFIILLWVLEI